MNKNSVRLYDDASFKSEDHAISWLPYHYHQHKYNLLSLKLFSNYHVLLNVYFYHYLSECPVTDIGLLIDQC